MHFEGNTFIWPFARLYKAIFVTSLYSRIVFISLSALFFHPINGQLNNIRFSYLTSDNGLSSSWVRCVAQDQQGFIWIGTMDGLNKYDGYNYEIFYSNPFDSASLYSSQVFSLFIDTDGTLWIGTSSGVNIFNRLTNTFIRKSEIPRHNIYDIVSDGNGNILIGSQELYVYNKNTNKVVSYSPQNDNPDAISNGMVNTVFIDSKKNIWIGTQNGLNLFDIKKGSFKKFFSDKNVENSLIGNDIRAITEDNNNTLWIGTTQGLNSLTLPQNNPDSAIFIQYAHNPSNPLSLSYPNILSLHFDKKNNLWIGTQNGGLDIFTLSEADSKPKSLLNFELEIFTYNGINNNSIQCIFEDDNENMWLGTYAGGINLYCINAKPFKWYAHIPNYTTSINNNHVNTFFEDNDYLWIGTEGGINQYDKKTRKFKYFMHDPDNNRSLGSDAVWAIKKDIYGNLWVGNWDGGLNKFDYATGQFKRYLHDPSDEKSIGSTHVRSIYPDKDGSLWIGTMGGGLSHFNPVTQEFKNYNIKNSSITTDYIPSIVEYSDHKIIFANVIGVMIFDTRDQSFKPFNFDGFKDISLNNLNVFSIFIDSHNNLWFGTEAGLIAINEGLKKYKYYTTKHGLPNNSIKSILEDSKGNLWLGTNGGLIKFINAVEIPEEPVFKKYSIEDGLQGNEFNLRSCFKSIDGTMYFGGINGYNVFHPDSIYNSPQQVRVIITDFKLFNKPVIIGGEGSPLDTHISEQQELVLNYRQNSFSFKYVALNYVSPGKTRFAYKLEGFDKDWKYVQNQREASYTNISPGKYRFMVKASNNDEIWNEVPKIITVIVLPPVWRTIWAYIFYGALIILALFLIRKYSIIDVNRKNQLIIDQLSYSKQEEINQAKLHFFTNLSHEIRTPLTLISSPVEDLFNRTNDNIYFKERLKLINHNVKRLLYLINQLLDFRKIDTGYEKLNAYYHNMSALTHEIIEAFKYQKGLKKIHISYTADEQVFAWFDLEKMTTVLYNLVANAVKYNSESGDIVIEINKIYQPALYLKPFKWNIFKKRGKKNIEYIEFKITDQGHGIPEEELDNIFDRYYQAFKSGFLLSKGTGIGLSLTKEYIELHKGRIWAESELGKGSCFVFQIPAGKDHLQPDEINVNNPNTDTEYIDELINTEILKKKDPAIIYANPAPPDKGDKQVVLLVEDNMELVNYLEEKLQDTYMVIKAKDGLEGLTLAQKYDPDIIVTDIIMPNMDGINMTMMLKTDLNTSHIPIIILTAKAFDDSRIESIEKGADAYIIKPFKIDLLQAYILTLLDSRKKLKEKYSQQLILEPGEITINKIDEDFFKRLILIVEDNISDYQFDVNLLSYEMNLSYRVLARKVKSLTNQNVNEFIRSVRLKRAAVILSKNKISITEVSTMTGFSDPAYFSRCFQKQYGISPTQYAERNENQVAIFGI